MIESLSRLALKSWTAPQIPYKIEYPAEWMEELRAFVSGELPQLSRVGRQAGGVLFGKHREGSLRIVTWRPFWRDPSRELEKEIAAQDRVALVEILSTAEMDPDFKDLAPLGWFISHNQSGITLTTQDVAIYAGFFPDPWQMTLVLRRGDGGAVEGGFFAREADGTLKSDASYQGFTVAPLRPASRAPAADPKEPALDRPLDLASISTPSTAPDRSQVTEKVPRFQLREHSFGGEKWLWLLPVLLIACVAALIVYGRPLLMPAPLSEPISLRVSGHGNDVEISWDQNAAPVRNADHADVKVEESGTTAQITLSRDQLRAGSLPYVRHSDDVGVEMTVYGARGSHLREFARMVAQSAPAEPAAPAAESPEVTNLRSQLQDDETQIRQLKEDARRQTTRADRLQQVVRILEERLNISQGNSNK